MLIAVACDFDPNLGKGHHPSHHSNEINASVQHVHAERQCVLSILHEIVTV